MPITQLFLRRESNIYFLRDQYGSIYDHKDVPKK